MKPVSPLKKLGALGLACMIAVGPMGGGLHAANESVEIYWETWPIDWIDPMGAEDPAGSTRLLQQLDKAGSALSNLAATTYSNDTSATITARGDIIELGYFRTGASDYTPSADSSNLFKGIWTPLTTSTAIGMRGGSGGASGYNDEPGQFHLKTQFSKSTGFEDKARTYLGEGSYEFTDTLDGSGGTTDLSSALTSLDAAGTAYLGMRFYDMDHASSTAPNTTTKSTSGATRYNTMSSTTWTWVDMANPAPNPVELALHTSTPTNVSVAFEFDNTDAYTANVAKVGTGDNRLPNDDFVATVTYHDGSSNLTLSNAGIGSTVLSGLSGSGTITDSGDGNVLTLHTAAGNTGANAFTFTGSITGDTTVIKTGTGEQILTGGISVTDTTGYVDVKEGTFTLTPAAGGPTQSMEYLTGDAGSTFKVDNTNDADHIVTFGMSGTTASQTFAGNVTLSGSGTDDIRVSSGTTDADYGKEQVFSGVVSGAAKLKKNGVGRLKLTGDNTMTGEVEISDGTLVVSGGSADLGSGTVTINKGKLEVDSGTSITNTIQGSTSSSNRGFIGGDGTVSAVTIGSASGQVDVVTPGEGISSSFNLANKQAVRGKATADVSADASIGSFTATTLSLLNGGVYDWEISNFNGSGTAGTDWDLLNFDTLNLGAKSDTFTINVYGIVPDSGGSGTAGTAGAPKDADGSTASLWSRGGTKFKFLDGGGGSTVNWTGGTQWTTSELTSYFQVRDDDLAHWTNMHGGDWTVTYESDAFYLNFSAVPEPSTYVMVTGLLALPGLQFLRRLRKKKGDKEG